jgi:very-short-patch-repair endonuclease
MTGKRNHSIGRGVWALAWRQHGVVTHEQLLELGFTRHGISHRVEKGRLHPVWRKVYAVGRPELTQHGRWMAAVLACGPGAAISHEDAGALLGIRPIRRGEIEVSVPGGRGRKHDGIVVHRRSLRAEDVTRWHGIPVTTAICTIVDLAGRLSRDEVEQAINDADIRGLTDPVKFRKALDRMPPRPGVGMMRDILDRRTFRFTRSRLERAFRPIARRAGLPEPQTRCWVNGFEVDFYFAELGLVVETDSLTYHRTPQQQAKDLLRDQAHSATGSAPLRFSHGQIKYEPGHVEETLRAVAHRLRAAGQTPP